METLKAEIISSAEFSFENLLAEIDLQNVGYVDFNNLFEFFRKNAFYPYEEEIIAILRRLDKNDDGRLTISELEEALTPKGLEITTPQIQKDKASKLIESTLPDSKKSRVSKSINYENANKKASVKEKSLDDNIDILTNKILSDKKKSQINEIVDDQYEQPIKDSIRAKTKDPNSNSKARYTDEMPTITERKSRLVESQKQSDLTEKKQNPDENIKANKKSSLHQEIIRKNEEKLNDYFQKEEDNQPDYSFSNKKTMNIGSTYTSTPPKYPRPVKTAYSTITEKTPPHLNYYPYEPVRRAFSPMKEQIMKSSRTPPRKPQSSQERLQYSQRKSSNSKNIYEKRSSFHEKPRNLLEDHELDRKGSAIKANKQEELIESRENEEVPIFQQENKKKFSTKIPQENVFEEKRISKISNKPEKMSIYQEKALLDEKSPYNEKPQVFSDEKRSSKTNYQEKPLIYSSEKKNSIISDPYAKRVNDPYAKKSIYEVNDPYAKKTIYELNDKKPSIYETANIKKQSIYQEKQLNSPEDKRFSSKRQEEIPTYQEKPMVYSDEKKLSIKNQAFYEKPQSPAEEKRFSNKNQIIQEKPQESFEDKRFSTKNQVYQEKPQMPSEDKRFSTKNQVFVEKPQIPSEEKRSSNPIEEKRFSSKPQNPSEDKRFSKNQELFQEKPQQDKRFSTKNQETYQEQPEEKEEDYKKKFSPKNEEVYQEKPQISSEDKRLSMKNQEKPQLTSEQKHLSQVFYQENPQISPEDKKFSIKNEKMSVAFQVNDKRASGLSKLGDEKRSIYQEKPQVFAEDKRTISKKDDKKASVVSKNLNNDQDEYDSPIEEDKIIGAESHMANSEKSIDVLQEKARLQSLKIDELMKKEQDKNYDTNDSINKKGRNSDLGFYTKNEYLPLKGSERKSAPLIIGHNSFNSEKNPTNESNISENQQQQHPKQSIMKKKNHSIHAELQVKEESENEENESDIDQNPIDPHNNSNVDHPPHKSIKQSIKQPEDLDNSHQTSIRKSVKQPEELDNSQQSGIRQSVKQPEDLENSRNKSIRQSVKQPEELDNKKKSIKQYVVNQPEEEQLDKKKSIRQSVKQPESGEEEEEEEVEEEKERELDNKKKSIRQSAKAPEQEELDNKKKSIRQSVKAPEQEELDNKKKSIRQSVKAPEREELDNKKKSISQSVKQQEEDEPENNQKSIRQSIKQQEDPKNSKKSIRQSVKEQQEVSVNSKKSIKQPIKEQQEELENSRKSIRQSVKQQEILENSNIAAVNQEEIQRKGSDVSIDVVKYFKTVLNCEEELERCKQDLSLRPDFNLVDFFLFFDKEKQGYCVKEEFQEVLTELGIQFQQENLHLFLKRFVKGEGDTLKFFDFSEVFTPLLTDYAELLNQRKPINIDFQFKYREVN